MSIKAIDRSTVHKICSGQVIVSLAIAVKELVENALDAGATVIEVKLKEHGSQLIEVSDNGQGVTPNNFQGLTFKHHTSKIRDFTDLVGVETFGFRGEALSSLCALCELSISTRHISQECGSNLFYDFTGKLIKNVPTARQIGTTVSLTNIFSTLPVRHKEFRRNLTKEYNKMLQLLYAYGLVSTGVRISCTNQSTKGHKSVVFATNGSQNVKDNVASIFGSKQVLGMQELTTILPSNEVFEDLKADEAACSIFKLDGLISSCAHNAGRGAPDRQFYFINSRPCEPSKISKAVNDIYHQYNLHQYPFVFLNITVAKGSVDVNVTPDKRQIFFDNEKLLIAMVKASLENVYKSTPSTFVMNDISKLMKSSSSPSVKTEYKPRESLLIQMKLPIDSTKRKHEDLDAHHSAKVLKMSYDTLDRSSQEIIEIAVEAPREKMSSQSWSSSECQSQDVDMERSDYKQPLALGNSQRKPHVEIVPLICDKTKSNIIKNDHNASSNIAEDGHCKADTVPTSTTNASDSPEAESQEVDEPTFECQDTNSQTPSLQSQIDVDLSSVKYDAYEEKDTNNIIVSIGIEEIKTLTEKRFKKALTLNEVLFRSAIDPSKNSEAEDELKRVISKDLFKQMEIIGQFNLGFIIAKLENDLFIIDQHASDEKFNFETLQKSTVINNQKLVVPQPLELTVAYQNILMDNLEIFKKNGFEFNFNENAEPTKKVTMVAVPLSVNRVFGKEDVDELLFMLQESNDKVTTCRPSGIRAMFASRACRKSVMVGTSLSHTDMKKLVSQMGTIEHPWNCPHGRPTMRHLVNTELVKKMRSSSSYNHQE